MGKAAFVVNVEAVVHRDDRYLMIVRADEDFGAGWLCFPGGTVDQGDPEDDVLERTARREVLEEVGLDVPGPWSYVESHSFDANGTVVLDVVYMAPSEQGEPQAISAEEVTSVHWMTAAEIDAHPDTQPWTKRTLALAQERQSGLRVTG